MYVFHRKTDDLKELITLPGGFALPINHQGGKGLQVSLKGHRI